MTCATNSVKELNQSAYMKNVHYKMEQDELINLINSKIYKLNSQWTFDENNAIIIAPDRKFYLTQKEMLFLKMLLKNEAIVTYTDMIKILWNDGKYVTLNAVRTFTKNFKKKLPPEVLKNFQNMGYKLDL